MSYFRDNTSGYWLSEEANLQEQVVEMMRLLVLRDEYVDPSSARQFKRHDLMTIYVFAGSQVTSIEGTTVTVAISANSHSDYELDDRARLLLQRAFSSVMDAKVALSFTTGC